MLLWASFLCLGAFCGANSRLAPYEALAGWELPGRWATAVSERIDGVMGREFVSRGGMGAEGTSSVTAPLLKAILLGDKSELPASVVTAFRESGASHILALSGLHLGIIYGIISLLLWPLRSRRGGIIKTVVTLTTCTFYAIATGFSTSIARALIFIYIREITVLRSGYGTGSTKRLVETLATAALVQLCFIGPSALFSVGFQLSYLAILGIALLGGPLQDMFPEPENDLSPAMRLAVKPLKYIWNIAALSIACQAFTAPVVYMYFGTVATQFLLTNIIALPLCSLIVFSAVAAIATGLPFAAEICDALCSALVFSLKIIAK